MKHRTFLFLCLVIVIINHSNAGRTSGRSSGSRSGSRSSSSGSRSSSSGSRSSSSGNHGYSPSHTSYQQTSSHTNYGSSSSHPATTNSGRGSSSNYGTTSGHPSAPPGQSTSGSSSSTGRGASPGSSQSSKDINTSFLNGEGGGATRPAQTMPSAPSAPPISHIPGQYRPPGHTTDSRQSSPYNPSAPPIVPAAPSFGSPSAPFNPGHGTGGQANPPWSNPHLGNQPAVPGSQPSHVGFNPPYPTSHGANPPYPTSHGGNPPYPTSHGVNPPYPTSHGGNPPYPTSHGVNPPYPISHGVNPPYPISHGGNPPYPTSHGVNSPYPTSYPSNPNYPASGGPFGHAPYPHPTSGISAPYPGHQPGQVPMGNPYQMHPSGTAYNVPGQTSYPQHVLAQPAAQPYIPGQTVIMVPGQQDSGRGFGQMLKEALVYSTVNAGVNRLINPYPHHVHDSRPDSGSTGSVTHVTYNNQYYNTAPGSNGAMDAGSIPQGTIPAGTPFNNPSGPYIPPNIATSGAPSTVNPNIMYTPNAIATSNNAGTTVTPGISAIATNTSNDNQNSSNNPVPDNLPQYVISDSELLIITEELFAVNTFKYKLAEIARIDQKHVTSPNVTEGVEKPLITAEPRLFDHPTIVAIRALFDNYEHNSSKKENHTLEHRKEENLLIDTLLNTNVMARAMKWLSDHGLMDPDDFEKKDILRQIWFKQFDGSTSGFERIFASENYGNVSILGVQDWIYFHYQESQKRIDFMGLVDNLNFGDTAALLKVNFKMDGIVRPNATIFVGTPPELEMALYTICFYARPNNLCPVSFASQKFTVYTHAFNYFGRDLIDLALPMF